MRYLVFYDADTGIVHQVGQSSSAWFRDGFRTGIVNEPPINEVGMGGYRVDLSTVDQHDMCDEVTLIKDPNYVNPAME